MEDFTEDPYADIGNGQSGADPYADIGTQKPAKKNVLLAWLDRKLAEQKAKNEMPLGKRLIQEVGNIAMPAGDFGLISTANQVFGDGSPTKAPLGIASPNAPTPARFAKSVIDPFLGGAQTASRLTGIGNQQIDSAINSISDYYGKNFDESPAGEAAGTMLPMLFSGGTAVAPGALSLAKGGLGFLKGAVASPFLTPEANIKNDEDYSGRKKTEAVIGGLLGSVPLLAYVAKKWGKPVAQAVFQKAFDVTDENKSTAARRIIALGKLNDLNETDLKMTIGQLTDNPRIKGAESFSEYIPGGLSKTRMEGNKQTLNMLQNRVARSANERDTIPYEGINELVDAVQNGDKNAARILRDIVERAGSNNEKVIGASKEVNIFPLKQRNKALWDMFGTEGDALGPISMEGETQRLSPLIAKLERVLGPDSPSLRTAKAVSEDISRAQSELFPPRLPEEVYSGFTPSYPKGGVGEFLSGARGAETIPAPEGSVREFLQLAHSPTVKRGVHPQPNSPFVGQPIPPVERWERPPSTSTDLNAGNVHESISRLKEVADSVRQGNPRLAGELDQIVTGMDTRLEQAASSNPTVRATLDAAKFDTKDVLYPVRDAGTAATLHGINKEPIPIPEAIALEGKGKAAARNLADAESLAKGQDFGGRQLGIVDNDKVATILGDRSLDQFFSGANAEERNALLEILRATTENAQITKNPKTGNRVVPIEILKMALGGGGGLATLGLGGPGSRALFSGKAGNELLLQNPDWQRKISDNPQLRRILELAGVIVQ